MIPGVMYMPEPTTAPMTRNEVSIRPIRLRKPDPARSSVATMRADPFYENRRLIPNKNATIAISFVINMLLKYRYLIYYLLFTSLCLSFKGFFIIALPRSESSEIQTL